RGRAYEKYTQGIKIFARRKKNYEERISPDSLSKKKHLLFLCRDSAIQVNLMVLAAPSVLEKKDLKVFRDFNDFKDL
ncbi:MAG: hypothetical protein J5698_02335, partial [Bacteroidaceae bacterium]|nr:hypothetical protein [Bacteroidaceae bacterium]